MIRYRARWVVPVTSEPIEDGVVAVESGKIAYVGPTKSAPSGSDRDLGDALILPGLVNTHTHLELTFMRGFLEDLSFSDWIARLRKSRNEVLTDGSMLDAARLGIAEGIRAGVTSYADTCSTGVVLQAMIEAGVRGIMYQEIFGPSPDVAAVAMEELKARIAAHRELVTDLVAVGVSPHAPYTVSPALYAAVSEYTKSEKLPLAMHIAESEDEDLLVREGVGPFGELWARRGIPVPGSGDHRTPVDLLERHGLLRKNSLLIHITRADENNIGLIAKRGCSVAHCPVSNAKLGHGIAPLPQILSAGIRVGLGSDSVASNNRMDILEEARMALLLQRAASRRHDTMNAQSVLELATISGASALGLDEKTGSLEVGKDADLCAFPLDREKSIPVIDPVATAVFALGGTEANLTVVAGKELLRDGDIPAFDREVLTRAKEVGVSLRTWAASQG